MPITKSAEKALRQSKRRHVQNLKRQNDYKDAIKQIKKMVASGKNAEAEKLIPSLYQALDKAAKTNVIKKNKSSRLKSRVTKFIRKQKTS